MTKNNSMTGFAMFCLYATLKLTSCTARKPKCDECIIRDYCKYIK
ncbi:MAG: hypothetical protein GX078_07195 [Clostridiales bacterium]|nr:hypothetical protein [Clostridiales bacterium]